MNARELAAQARQRVSDDDLPDMAEAPICPSACRALWMAVLYDQWRTAFPAERVSTITAHDSAAAVAWFRGQDCAHICGLLGIEPEFLHRKLSEALAAVADGTRSRPSGLSRQVSPRERALSRVLEHARRVGFDDAKAVAT